MKVQKIPNVVIILILTLITVIMWISLTIYGALTSKPPAVVPKEVSEPLTPTLDIDTLKQIESRIFLDDSQIPDNVVTAKLSATTPSQPTGTSTSNPTPTPNLSQEPISSPSASPSP
ncbi:MAG: hypothetical protein HYV90_01460 [Candidatus Woesebacteria bacterium]|nr:MAG: hypothetical protein HYV90_01460 [Candidatus Woesebacteria bacterium]